MQVTRRNTATQDSPPGLLGLYTGLGLSHIEVAQYQFFGVGRCGRATTCTEDWLIPLTQGAGVDVEDLVGSWRDERDVEEIVRDIYDSRTA